MTDNTSTHYDATVTLFFIYRRKVKAERNPKNIRSHAKEVRQQLGLVVDVFTLVKDSDVPVLLVPAHCGACGLVCHTFSLEARGTQWAQ